MGGYVPGYMITPAFILRLLSCGRGDERSHISGLIYLKLASFFASVSESFYSSCELDQCRRVLDLCRFFLG